MNRMTQEEIDIARILCARVDWEQPALRVTKAYRLHEGGDCGAAALALIRFLRERETPRLGYTREYVQQLRESSEPEWLAEAAEVWEDALKMEIILPYHSNPFAAMGPEVFLTAATTELCDRMAKRVVERREDWSKGFWGGTHSICELLRLLWPLNECRDAALLPIFGWLVTKSEAEWRTAGCWNETMLGISGHNWWVHAYFGFWMMGTFFAELKGASQYAAFSGDFLERELSLLFEDDGWSKEGAPGYHTIAYLYLVQFSMLAELNGTVLSTAVKERLRTIADALWKMLMPDGDFPLFGDFLRLGNYQGVVGLKGRHNHPCRIVKGLAALFSLPEAKYVSVSLAPEGPALYRGRLPLMGRDLFPAWERLPSVTPSLDTALRRSGLYAMRQDWSPRADCVALSAGTLGPRITSHKHADLLSFELYSRGRRILVDNGYGAASQERSDDSERLWRVGSAAHNTTTVDGEDHVPVVREFLFGATQVPVVDDWRSDASYAYFSGVHEGYLRLKSPVSAVRRKLFYLRGKYWILIDRFTAANPTDEHTYRLHFQLGVPGDLDGGTGRVTTRGEGGNLLIVPVPGACGGAALSPHPYPLKGYENPEQLCYTARVAGHFLFVTLLVPFEGAVAPKVEVSLAEVDCAGRLLSPWEGTGLNISIDGEHHLYFDQHLQWNLPWSSGCYRGQNRLFHSEV